MEQYFPEFLALLFPAIHAEIDWTQGVQFLDKKFQQIVREKANPEKKLMWAVGAASAVTEHAANWTCRQLGCPTRLKSPFRVACEITTSDSKPQLAQELMNSDHDQRITFNPRQCGGRPCIRGMRIRVADILEMLAQGVEVKEILADFPDLEPEDINACLHYAAKRSDIPRLAA